MTSRRLILLCLLLNITSIVALSQPAVPEILPASPEPASFVKAGLGGINFSTGALQTSIPLFDLKVNNISHSISLSYQSQGLRMDEIPSRVGLGWNLIAGGVITRTVRGAPDELGTPLPEPADFTAENMATFRYFDLASQADPVHEYDTQKDEFSFSAGGYAGKFVLDSANKAVIMSHSNVKIQAYTAFEDYTGFIMTTPDGLKYYFGYDSSYEKTVTHNLYAYSHYADRIKTSFFLRKIENLSGQSIIFNYNRITITTHPGITQTVVVRRGVFDNFLECNHCAPVNTILSNTINTAAITYDTRYLTSIQCSNGLYAEISYENRPDYGNDKRITRIKAKFESTTLKDFTFTYYDQHDGSGTTAAGTSVKNGRFFLTKVSYIENFMEGGGPATHEYKLDYNDPASIPARLSSSQDYLGFYNGAGNGNCFLPVTSELSSSTACADRNYNATYAAKGVLQKITYPTGGTEEFYLEGNTLPDLEPLDTTLTLTGTGTGTPGVNSTATFLGTPFLVYKAQTITVNASSFQNASYSGGYYPVSYDYIARVKLKNLTTNSYVLQATLYAYSSGQYSVDLVAGNTYKMELYVYQGWSNQASFSLSYDYGQEGQFNEVNVQNGGIRVRKIRLYDSLANKSVEKYYRYATRGELGKSSGKGSFLQSAMFKDRVYTSLLAQLQACVVDGNFAWDPYRSYEICINESYSSNTNNYVSKYDGSHIYYTSIIESDDSLFVNGGTEYKYHDPTLGRTDWVIRGVKQSGIPDMNYPIFNGVLKEKNIFKSNLSVIRQEINEYAYDSNYLVRVPSVDVRRKYTFYYADSAANNTVFFSDVFDAFDVVKYEFQSMWIQLKKSKVIETDANGIIKMDSVLYLYGTSLNTEVAKTESRNSKSQLIEKFKYYPTDYPSDATLQKLVAKNKISFPVEEVTKISNNELQRQKVIYADWYSNQTVLEPQKIQYKASSSDDLHDEVIFNSYNIAGLPSGYSKVNDISVSYIYDPSSFIPVAEVKNADTTQIAFTSFENQGWGYWSTPGTYLPEGSSDLVTYWTLYSGNAVTGNLSFGGVLTKAVNSGTAYLVTLWCKNGYSATVNGNSGNLLTTKNGWNLYKWDITGQASVTVQGNYIDEVRLHPKKAFMTTFVHNGSVGPACTNDLNNNITYYEYDMLNRLYIVRDADKSILKKYEYKYRSSIPCTNTTAGWENTTTALRCQLNSSFENTGYQEQEQKDMNPCSSTYGQTRWVVAGYNSTSCPLVLPSITVTHNNLASAAGFSIVFTNTATSQTYNFSMPSSGSGNLGTVPSGTYNISISRSSGGILLLFGTGCQYQSGTNSANFSNVVVDNCHAITIDFDLM